MLKVGIIGLGWLGNALAEHLNYINFIQSVSKKSEAFYEIIATKRSSNSNNSFAKIFTWNFDDAEFPKEFNPEICIITLTPSAINNVEKFDDLIKSLHKNGVSKIIYTSSTGVYDGMSGVVKESSKIEATSDKQKHLLSIENAVLAHPKNIVLRLAGLVSDDRHPGKFLAGKKGITGPNQSINLVHRVDVVQILTKLLTKDISGVINVVSDAHTNKKTFYTELAKRLNLELPEFSQELIEDRVVDNSLSKELLNYDYLIDDVFDYFMKLKIKQ